MSYAIFTGFLAAAAHVFSGPDHLAAVAPFAVGSTRKSWKIGLFWGLGHLAGMLLIGILFTMLKDFPPLELISSYSESLVGVVLVGVGIWAIYKAFFPKNSIIEDGSHHHHHGRKANIASFSIGSLHGLAGVAHFILFLPVLGFENSGEAAFYITGFALGTVAAMIFFTFLLGYMGVFGKNDKRAFMKILRLITGIAAIGVGIYWMFIN
ncbi:hypothetical protein [Robertkochia sediminum]|uniref:hypothetical protein n=1 Tax=Robertkochia sediminum TaxID=2785326 RepID=UPI0019334E13|nr:hypothetical protein [Robertkochia sediminum]MBL7472310.1 High-affinity nickel transporter [Robertkochia sediminum]